MVFVPDTIRFPSVADYFPRPASSVGVCSLSSNCRCRTSANRCQCSCKHCHRVRRTCCRWRFSQLPNFPTSYWRQPLFLPAKSRRQPLFHWLWGSARGLCFVFLAKIPTCPLGRWGLTLVASARRCGCMDYTLVLRFCSQKESRQSRL